MSVLKMPSPETVERRLTAYLAQRGRMELKNLAVALGMRVASPADARGRTYNATNSRGLARLDEMATKVAPYRTEAADGTITYHRNDPHPKRLFVPVTPPPLVTTIVDPALAGTWTPEQAEQQRAEQKAAQQKAYEQAQAARQAEAQPITVITKPKEEDEMVRYNRKPAECEAALRQVLTELHTWPEGKLYMKFVIEACAFSSSYFSGHPDLKQEAEEAIQAERARRYANQAQAVAQVEETLEAIHSMTEPQAADLAELATLQRRIAELEQRNQELQQQLGQPQPLPETSGDLLTRYLQLEAEMDTIDRQIAELTERRTYLLEDHVAMQRTLVLLGLIDLEEAA